MAGVEVVADVKSRRRRVSSGEQAHFIVDVLQDASEQRREWTTSRRLLRLSRQRMYPN